MSYLRECTERKTSKLAYSVRCKRVKFQSADNVTLRGDFAVKMAHFCKVTYISFLRPNRITDQRLSDRIIQVLRLERRLMF